MGVNNLPLDLVILLPETYPANILEQEWKDMHTRIFTASLFIFKKPFGYLLVGDCVNE